MVENFATGLITLMGGLPGLGQPVDAQFRSEFAALLGVNPHVVVSNRPVAEIGIEHLPAIVVEQGDGNAAPISEGDDQFLAIGGGIQSFSSTLDMAVVWKEQDHTTAFTQRTRLPDIFARFLLRNPRPGGIAGAWLASWEADRAVNHPTQIWVCTIRGDYEVLRS